MPTMVTLVLIVQLATAPAAPADWPGWRGAGRDGVVEGFKAPAAWPEKLREAWHAEVGEGHSSPVVAGGRVFAFARVGGDEVARAFDLASGKELWRKSYPAPYEVSSAARSHGAGPKSTPAFASGRLFTLGIGGILTCFDASTGDVRWRKDFSAELPKTSPLYGTAMSPLLEGSLVIVHAGGHDRGALRAFDAETGAVRWSLDGDGPSYSSPVAADLAGVRQVVTQTQTHVVGVAAGDGKLLWKVPFSTEYDQNAVTVVVWKDLVVYSGYLRSTAAVRIRRDGDKLMAEEAWSNPEVPMFMSTPVLHGGTLFGMSQRQKGHLFALDPSSGKTLWKGPGRLGDNASILSAGEVLVVLTEGADLLFLKPKDSELVTVKQYKVAPSATWAHAVLAGDRILVKDRTALRALELGGGKP
ncbi:MAG: PQQ-like beta-propeller repeat protein [Planctomycetes bacterium]|nr:PQQ-like beta-propeller repeat protein [Planctomycetota bacterium]